MTEEIKIKKTMFIDPECGPIDALLEHTDYLLYTLSFSHFFMHMNTNMYSIEKIILLHNPNSMSLHESSYYK